MAGKAPLRLVVQGLDAPCRLDRYLRDCFPEWGRRAVGGLIQGRQVRVNNRPVWLASWKVQNGDQLEIHQIPPSKPAAPTRFQDAWLVAETPDLIVVNKPAGVLSHSSRSKRPGDLLSLAQARFGPVSLMHRLDRDTSGLVLLTRSRPLNQYLDRMFKARRVCKIYLGLVQNGGDLPEQGVFDMPLGPHPERRDMMAVVSRGGQAARTEYRIVGAEGNLRLVELRPVTGRTHQLRVHLAAAGAPILGDRLYGPRPPEADRLMLHAWRIEIPGGDGQPERAFQASLPADFKTPLPERIWQAAVNP